MKLKELGENVTQTIKINCDICNKELKENEIQKQPQLLGLAGNKPESKFKFGYNYEGQKKKGDLCMSCGRKLRDFIEDMKEGKLK